jgi:uncharacterized membrane protein SpoIIM required for sporulation
VLWLVILAELIISGLLIRVGLAYFNREELLGRELDSLNLYWGVQLFRQYFRGQARSLFAWYRDEVFKSLHSMGLPILVSSLAILIGILAGVKLAGQFQLPPERLALDQLDKGFIQGLEGLNFFSSMGVAAIWLHNLEVIALATMLGVFSFGVLGLLVLMLPLALIAYITANIALAGYSPTMFLAALVLPHGIFEIPAIILAGAALVSLGASLIAPAHGRTIGEAWISALAKWLKITLGLVLPLFLAAAFMEVFVTPRIAVWIFSH